MSAAFELTDISAERLRVAFDAPAPLTVGLEEEVMLLDPETLDLVPGAADALERLRGDSRFKGELPASQLEVITEPVVELAVAISALSAGRRDLAAALNGSMRLAIAGTHPFAAADGELSASDRYARTRAEYGPIARRQLVTSLQVHVAVGSADRTLAVYNALRSHLPDIAALAANAPFYEGRDTGLASVRPKIAELLPRQGVPPAIGSWEELASELRWGAKVGSVIEARQWWWELRLHPSFGTLEVRVPDAQTTLDEATGVAAFAQALVAWLSERAESGHQLAVDPTWRIEENRWSAARHGVEGEMADLETGELEPTRVRLQRLLDELEPVAERLGSARLLDQARELARANGAMRQREAATGAQLPELVEWLSDRYLLPSSVLESGGSG